YVSSNEQFLVKLLCWPQPGVRDGNIAVRIVLVAHGQAHQVDHAARQVANLYGLAHVEYEYIPSPCHGAGLDNKLRGLRDGHEIPDDFAVSNGYRTALPYLLTEQGNDRPRRCQYVAKPNHAEADGRVFILQTLQDEFGTALGRAHDAGWADRLVGGYQYERVGARLDRSLRKMQSAEDVVVHTFEKVVLNNVHVLVCSGVIDGVNTVHLQHFAHP